MSSITTEFSARMQQILLLLLQKEGVHKVQELADQMKISKRTVQRELDGSAAGLKKYGLRLCTRAGSGIWLEGGQEEKSALLQLLASEDSLDVTDKAERCRRLTLEILKDKDVKKLYYYSTLFGVSEATVSSDLETVEEWLLKFGLAVVRRPGLGISIEGKESSFRQALRAFVDENLNSSLLKQMYTEQVLPGSAVTAREDPILQMVRDKSEKNIYRILDETTMKRVIRAVGRVENPRLKKLTENSYIGLIFHVAIAIYRIEHQEPVEANDTLISGMKRDEDYELAERIVGELEGEFALTIPTVEVAYICLHIKGAKVQQYETYGHPGEQIREYHELLELVNEMIDRYDPEVAYALKQDEEFVVQGLMAHLQPTLVRLQNHMNIQNPLLDHIKQEYAEIYERCLGVSEVITEHFGYQVPEAETGFLAIHFGAAMVRLENRKEVKRRVQIGVVCASGIGISRLLVSKLNNSFPDRTEITAYGLFDLTPFVLKKLDFLISTLAYQGEIETITVSPILTEADLKRIGDRVRFYERTPEKDREDSAFQRQLEAVNYMAAQIRSMLQSWEYLRVPAEVDFQELLRRISRAITPYEDWQELIVRDIGEREKLGTQVFPDFGFALLHAKTAGVSRPSFLIAQTEKLEAFTDPCFQKINTAIVMLLPDDEHVKENRELFGYLSGGLVEDEAFLDTILGGEKAAIGEELNRQLKRFFNLYLDKS